MLVDGGYDQLSNDTVWWTQFDEDGNRHTPCVLARIDFWRIGGPAHEEVDQLTRISIDATRLLKSRPVQWASAFPSVQPMHRDVLSHCHPLDNDWAAWWILFVHHAAWRHCEDSPLAASRSTWASGRGFAHPADPEDLGLRDFIGADAWKVLRSENLLDQFFHSTLKHDFASASIMALDLAQEYLVSAAKHPTPLASKNGRSTSRRHGAPVRNDPAQDRRIDEAVKSIGSRAAVAKEFKLDIAEVERAQARHRSRRS